MLVHGRKQLEDSKMEQYDDNHFKKLCKPRKEKCEFCEVHFYNRYRCLIHTAKHIIIPLIKHEIFRCKHCLFCFTSQTDLMSHKKVKHTQDYLNELMRHVVTNSVAVKCEKIDLPLPEESQIECQDVTINRQDRDFNCQDITRQNSMTHGNTNVRSDLVKEKLKTVNVKKDKCKNTNDIIQEIKANGFLKVKKFKCDPPNLVQNNTLPSQQIPNVKPSEITPQHLILSSQSMINVSINNKFTPNHEILKSILLNGSMGPSYASSDEFILPDATPNSSLTDEVDKNKMINHILTKSTQSAHPPIKIEDIPATDLKSKITNNEKGLSVKDYAKAPFYISQAHSNSSNGPSNSSQVPSRSSQVPSNSSQVPLRSSQVPSNNPQVTSNSSQVPSNRSQVPSNSSQVPSRSSEPPTNSSIAPSNKTEILNRVMQRAEFLVTIDGTNWEPKQLKDILKVAETKEPEEFKSVHYDDLVKPGMFRCKRCGLTFPNKFDVITHDTAVHLRIKKRSKFGAVHCTTCDWYIAGNHYSLRNHIEREHGTHKVSRRFEICDKCSLKYTSLDRHNRNYHDIPIKASPKCHRIMRTVDVFLCDVCSMFMKNNKHKRCKFTTEGVLQEYGKRYTCSTCNSIVDAVEKFKIYRYCSKHVSIGDGRKETDNDKKRDNEMRLKNIQRRLIRMKKINCVK